MSKLRQWKEAEDQRLAEEAAQRALNERIAEFAIHPLVRANCDRNLREAYFYGLVYAGICDDLKIDETEEHLLNTIGAALALEVDFVMEAMTHMCEVENAAKMDLFAESLGVLKGLAPESLQHLFASEFIKVRMLHPENEPDLPADLKDIGEGLGLSFETCFATFKNVVTADSSAAIEDVDRASALLGDDSVKYLVLQKMGCIDDVLDEFRIAKATAEAKRKEQEENRRTLPARLAAIIEGDDTWPVEFNPKDYQPLFDAAGIPADDVCPFVVVHLLSYMKLACEKAKANIGNAGMVNQVPDFYLHGARFEVAKEFRILFRFAFFLDAFVELNGIYEKYYFIGPKEEDSSYYMPSFYPSDRLGHITGKRISLERFKSLQFASHPHELFDRLCLRGCRIDMDESERYFIQWEELFAAIEKRYVESGSVPCLF